MRKNIAELTLEKIKDSKMKPKSKWYFLFREVMIWVLFGLSIIIGSIAFALILHLLKNDLWLMRRFLRIHEYLLYFPFFWLILLVVFIVLAYFHWQKTEKGYKFQPIVIILVSVVLSLILGTVLYSFDLGRPIDRGAMKAVPGYGKMAKMRGEHWMGQSQNRLAGEVFSEMKDKKFLLKSFSNEDWNIFAEQVPDGELIIIKIGDKIRILGEREDQNIFQAKLILPWEKPFNKSKKPLLMKENH
ncbi:hypothetical protein HQ571_05765 [Candidatus Kuenenbacteria bacterium]|nr:hypothetical protein [Candidatus Kuenenbacteria bacterium]